MADPRPLADPYSKERIAAVTRAEEEPYYDTSLAQAILARMGPGFAHAYQPNRKRFLQTPYEVANRGKYYHADADPKNIRTVMWPYGVDEEGEAYLSQFLPKRDTVYAFEPEPSAKTFAHEFRHRAGVRDESKNRLYDAMYSQTPEEWEDAVHMFRDYELARAILLGGKSIDVAQQELTEQDAEQQLRARLEGPERDELLGAEYDAAPERDKPPLVEEPSIVGFLMDLMRSPRTNWVKRSQLPYEKLNVKRKEK